MHRKGFCLDRLTDYFGSLSYIILTFKSCIPVSFATSERSLSAIRRLKIGLQNSMWQDKFTNLSLLYSKRDLSNHLCVDTLLNELYSNP